MYKFLFIILISTHTWANQECSYKCICKRTTQKDGADYLKMRCGDGEKVLHLDELELLNIANELVQLNLSNNNLQTFMPRVQLIVLQKLDLSKNQLSELQSHQFTEMPNLRRLDVSMNNIKHIDLLAFRNLKHLERLKMNQNQITSIAHGTFTPLENLKQLDISNNPLVCDCGLLWLLDWSKMYFIKLITNPKCNSPPLFKGHLLRKLKIGDDIHCKSPAGNNGLPIVELHPRENQVVFEGDKLTLQCYAPSITDSYDDPVESKLNWTWLDSDPKTHFSDLNIENQVLPSTGRIETTLTIPQLNTNHSGIWSCKFASLQGNHMKAITVVVISDETKYCPMTVTSNNKGTYNWPRTVVNYTVTMPCESLNLNYEVSRQKVSYECSKDGRWVALNTSMCSYISDTTKILEQFSKVNSSIEESARHFRNYTSNRSIFRDVMDLVYAVDTVTNYVEFAPHEHFATVGSILMDVANNLMELPRFYLREADIQYGSCKKLVNATETLASLSTVAILHKSNLALEVFSVKKEGFLGMKCTWYVNPNNRKDSLFSCVSNNQQDTPNLKGKVTEASITIPDTLFSQLQDEQQILLNDKVYNILIAMHATSKLFPIDGDRKGKEDVTSAVVGAKLAAVTVRNLTHPVFVMLRTPSAMVYELTPFVPVWWDPTLNNGSGSWSSEGCRFSHELPDHSVFACDTFGYYGLLQDVSHFQNARTGARFKLSHPAVYVGSLILFVTFLVVIMTYLLCYAAIQMPKKAKHSLVNTWITVVLTCFMYVFGIFQTEDVKVCQMVGMALHYLTLCSLLWMCVSVNCMYKRLSRNDAIGLQDDDLPMSEQPIRKPILGLYLVGWGVGSIICGLSAAINMNEYASPTHCFLRTGPALSALYIPFAVLSIFFCIFVLLIRCAVYNSDVNGHLSEGTQATEHVDLDLLEPNFPNADSRSVRSYSTKTATTELEDPEHAPSAQLKAHVIFFLLYVITWLSCAFATVPPFRIISYEEDFFSIAFAISGTTLSAFTLFFYCIARNDVRSRWGRATRWMRRKRGCFRTRNVSDTPPPVPQIQIQPLPLPPAPVVGIADGQIVSRSTSRSSSRTKTNSHLSNMLKGAADLNGSFSDHQGAKINNVNLVILHRAQYRTSVIPNIIENPTNAAEVFYNPHQSTVARKFFKRQKRNMMKKNNLAKPPRDVNSDTASVFSEPKLKIKNSNEQNMFGTNSKVNNTNIHVEYSRKVQQKNPNLFSDSAEDFDSVSNVPVESIVMNTERLRKKELCRHKKKCHNADKSQSEKTDNNMRSVSQQCTLEYSSETVSDSILDKTSPDKSPLPHQSSFATGEGAACPHGESFLSENASKTIHNEFYSKPGKDPWCRKFNKTKTQAGRFNYDRCTPRMYALRMAKGDGQSRTSSISVSDLDELYQQIRRGPQPKRNLYNPTHASPCLSDSEINSYVSDFRQRHDVSHSHDQFDPFSDDVETTV